MFQLDNRVLYIIIIILMLTALPGLFSGGGLLSLVLTLPGVIIAITFHEFAHAFAADRLGDDTPRVQGRLNLNPLSHLDPVGILLLITAKFGWGKPVQINPRNFSRKVSMSGGEAIVSLAGPLMNFILAILFTIILFIVGHAFPLYITTQAGRIIYLIIEYTIAVNIGLGVFNLIPLPPLDGSKIFKHFMPYNVKSWLENNERFFYIAFVLIWVTGLSGYIISPIIDLVSKGIYGLVSAIFNIFI